MSDKDEKPDSRQPRILHPIALDSATFLALLIAFIALVSELDTTIKRLEAFGVAIVSFAVFVAADLAWTRKWLRRSVALTLMISDTLVALGLGALFFYRTNVPQPALANLVPTGHSIFEKDSVLLGGGPVPEWWVASRGPISTNASPVDLQVFEWRESTHSWQVAFDAAKAVADGPEKAL